MGNARDTLKLHTRRQHRQLAEVIYTRVFVIRILCEKNFIAARCSINHFKTKAKCKPSSLVVRYRSGNLDWCPNIKKTDSRCLSKPRNWHCKTMSNAFVILRTIRPFLLVARLIINETGATIDTIMAILILISRKDISTLQTGTDYTLTQRNPSHDMPCNSKNSMKF